MMGSSRPVTSLLLFIYDMATMELLSRASKYEDIWSNDSILEGPSKPLFMRSCA
jgi:hypothetical protein